MSVTCRMERRLLAAALGTVLLSLSAQAGSQEMPKSLAEAQRLERTNSLPLTDFFSTPLAPQGSRAGDLLAHEIYRGYAVPAGVNAQRIIYHSLDAAGQGVTASAVVLDLANPLRLGLSHSVQVGEALLEVFAHHLVHAHE